MIPNAGKTWLNPFDWLLFRVQRGEASWCGRYLIIIYPRNWCLVFGRGTQGMWLYRWLERHR